jgi:hypothetical protein
MYNINIFVELKEYTTHFFKKNRLKSYVNMAYVSFTESDSTSYNKLAKWSQ